MSEGTPRFCWEQLLVNCDVSTRPITRNAIFDESIPNSGNQCKLVTLNSLNPERSNRINSSTSITTHGLSEKRGSPNFGP